MSKKNTKTFPREDEGLRTLYKGILVFIFGPQEPELSLQKLQWGSIVHGILCRLLLTQLRWQGG